MPLKPKAEMPYYEKGEAVGVWEGRVNQVGTNAPTTEEVYKNTLGGDLVWTRDNVGEYRATIEGVTITDNIFIQVTTMAVDGNYTAQSRWYRGGANWIRFSTTADGSVSDGVLGAYGWYTVKIVNYQ